MTFEKMLPFSFGGLKSFAIFVLLTNVFIMIENIKQGDTIEFYISCNADKKRFTGKVEYKDQLGFISIVDGVQYELKKLVDIKVLNVC